MNAHPVLRSVPKASLPKTQIMQMQQTLFEHLSQAKKIKSSFSHILTKEEAILLSSADKRERLQ